MRRFHRRRTGAAKSKKKRKILLRILFVILAAAVITALAVLLGTHLKHKANSAESLMEELSGEYPGGGGREERLLPEGVKSDGRVRSLKITAADLDISGVPEDEIISRVLGLSGSYNAVSIRVSRGGRLIYSSPAVAALAREREPDTVPRGGDGEAVVATVQTISDVAAVAHREGLRVNVIYSSAPVALGTEEDSRFAVRIDRAIVGELVSLGVDEIIVDGLFSDDMTLDFDVLSRMIRYLASLRNESGSAALGVLLPARVFSDAPTAAQVDTLSDYADLLAIDVPVTGAWDADSAYSAAESVFYPIRGSFKTYNLRAIIMADSPELSVGAYLALEKNEIDNVTFTSFVNDFTNAGRDNDTETETEPEPPVDERTNENAMTKDKYEETESETEPASEPEPEP